MMAASRDFSYFRYLHMLYFVLSLSHPHPFQLCLSSHISISSISTVPYFTHLHTQLFCFFKLLVPTEDFSGKTIIVTGANVGLGNEAAKHFVLLNAHREILAVRTIKKGEATEAEIETGTNRTGVVEVYELDYSSYASVKAFPARVADECWCGY